MSNRDAKTAKNMNWILHVGFIIALANYLTVQWTAPGIAGALLMAVPIVWVSWRNGL